MKKNVFYFSHDYNAANDVKILFLRQQLGMEGYGIYWYIIEQLANAGGRLPLTIIPVLAMQMHTSEVKVKGVIQNFDLFHMEEANFSSIRLNNHLDTMNEFSSKRSLAGKKGMEKRWNKDEKLITNDNTCYNTDITKDNKVNKSKVNKSKIEIPNEQEFLIYAKEEVEKAGLDYESLKYTIKAKFSSWLETGWIDGNGNEIKNWKTKFKNTLPYLKPIKTETSTSKIVLK